MTNPADNVVELPPHDDGPEYRTLPHNLEAERGLLGAILINNRAHEAVSEYLRPEHFALADHQGIYDALCRMIEAGSVADPVTMKGVGEPRYLGELVASAVTSINAAEYGRVIYECHLRRELIVICQESETAALDGADKARDILEATEARLMAVADTGHAGGARIIADTLGATLTAMDLASKGQAPSTIKTGIETLDHITGGLDAGSLVIVAGRPGMGKTILGLNIAEHAARTGNPALFFSMEMSAQRLNRRLLSRYSGIDTTRQRAGDVDWTAINNARDHVSALPLYIDDTSALTIGAIHSRARRMIRKYGIKLVVVDYLQLINPGKKYEGQRVNEVSEITRALKVMSGELGVTVIALSQLSRAVEQRENKRPQLSDLRDSGSIEQDADDVIFCYRHHYYLSKARPVLKEAEDEMVFAQRQARWLVQCETIKHDAELICAKLRDGDPATATVHFDGAKSFFGDRDAHTQEGMI